MPENDSGNKIAPQNPRKAPKKSRITRVIQHVEHAELHSGPLPSADMLRKYNEVLPGAAERIFNMAERQSEHRMVLERTVVVGDTKRADKGLLIGAAVAFVVLVGAITCILMGHDVAGGVIAAIDIGSIVYVFVHTNRVRQEERVQKAKSMALIRPDTIPPEQQGQ
jgi:uncharacterized membrane protein